MKPFRSCAVVLLLSAAASCERSRQLPPVESARVAAPGQPDSSSAAPAASTWDPGIGPVLMVAGESPTSAFVVVPDSGSRQAAVAGIPHAASVTLFGRGGTVQTAELSTLSDSGVCVSASLNAAPPPRPWSVGFIGGVVSPLAMDSLEALGAADSASLVAALNRLASALPNDSAGRFSGLPFVVRSIWRFTIPGGPQVIVGGMVRQINQEATPLQERTLLVAERASSDAPLTTAYFERSYGVEETVESREVLAAAQLGASREPALILSRDYGDETAYGIVVRVSAGRWRARWTSTRRRC